MSDNLDHRFPRPVYFDGVGLLVLYKHGLHIFFLHIPRYALGRVNEGVTNKVMKVGIARNGGCLLFSSVILDFLAYIICLCNCIVPSSKANIDENYSYSLTLKNYTEI